MSAPPDEVLIAVAYDSGSRGNPALRGRTAALAAAITHGARGVAWKNHCFPSSWSGAGKTSSPPGSPTLPG